MSQQIMPVVSIVVAVVGDGLADNYLPFDVFSVGTAGVPERIDDIGYNRDETVTKLTHGADFDDTVLESLHLMDDTTDYKNTSGKVAYAIVTVSARVDVGDRAYKIYSSPATDSKAGAGAAVFDSAVAFNNLAWDSSGEQLTSWLVPIQNDHFIVIENTSGATPRNIDIDTSVLALKAIVIEQAP